MSSGSSNINNIIDENEKINNHPEKVIFDTTVFAVDFTKASRKFWYIILIISLIFGFSAGYLKYISYTPMYESSVSFSVTSVSYSSNGTAVFASYYDNSSAAQLSKTFPYIVNTAMMRNALKNELQTPYINGTITAASVATDSNIFKVTVRSNSAEDAYNIVNAVINVYPDVTLFVVGNVNLKILIQPALPTEPYTTNNFIRIGLMMALIGLILGFCLVAVYAFFRNTIRKKDDFKNKLNQKCFVEIPYVTFYRTSKKDNKDEHVVRINDRHPTFKESFRLLRKRLLRHLHTKEKIIGITAPVYGEGKTMSALNLAHTLAIAHKKTACVDFDLRARSLQKYLKLAETKGFTDIISNNNPDYSSVCHKEDEYLDVYITGNTQFEYNNSDCKKFFDYLRTNYDYVIVNLAPVKDISSSVSISNLCDCLMFVTFQDRTSIDKIRKSIEIMSFSSARILGFIFNGVQDGFSGYGGYYYGGKYGYGKYGYGRYGYGKKYGYGNKYGYGKKYGYGYGYGDGEKHKKHNHGYGYGYGYGYGDDENNEKNFNLFIDDIDDNDIPDNS